MRITEILKESLVNQVLYHGGEKHISKFNIPPYGVYFSPHKEWALNYGDVITTARVSASKVYKIDYTHDVDDELIDALFDRDYETVAKFVSLLQSQGYQAMQSVTDSEMVVVFPGTSINVLQNINEVATQYKEIEFVCVNPQFPDATDPKLQKQMHEKLKQIPGVIPLWQEWGDYSEGQASLSAIYKDRSARANILKLAKQLGVSVDLEQTVEDDYVDRAIRGEHDGQINL